jgi:meso-butanediol dehydrogenase / (S,S)-butanediol dehydrogenase / diacetyl reductase
VVADLDEVNGRAAAKEIAASNQSGAIFQRVDVTDRTSVSAAIDACTRQFGSIKVMVNKLASTSRNRSSRQARQSGTRS